MVPTLRAGLERCRALVEEGMRLAPPHGRPGPSAPSIAQWQIHPRRRGSSEYGQQLTLALARALPDVAPEWRRTTRADHLCPIHASSLLARYTHAGEENEALALVDAAIARLDAALPVPERSPTLPGLVSLPDFVSEDEESTLLERLDAHEWRTGPHHRRQRHDAAPEWAQPLIERLLALQLFDRRPMQVGVTESVESEDVDTSDMPSFSESVAVVALVEPRTICSSRWASRNGAGTSPVHTRLERRAVAALHVLTPGGWTHRLDTTRHVHTHPAVATMRVAANRHDRPVTLTFRTWRVAP